MEPHPTPTLALRGRVVTPDATLPDGVVVVHGSMLAWVGPADDAPLPHLPAPSDRTLLPGLVDVHCHGGGGAGFPEATQLAQVRTAATEHRRHGTTTLVASLVTADPATLEARTALLAEAADAGVIDGIHLEGPFLSAARCGAQDPSLMQPGSAELVRRLARTAHGHLVSMTLAPEVPGVTGPDGVVAALAAAGALPSIGHTDAAAGVVEAALAEARAALAGPGGRSALPTATHLFNGMPPLHHRAPGPVAALLTAASHGDAVLELVADGVHLDPFTVRTVLDLVGPDHVLLVTDAMAATGMPDGAYELGSLNVEVSGGTAHLAGTTTIAGSTAHLLDVVRTTVAGGVPLEVAVRCASLTPARVLGRDDVGALVAGRRADVVETDAALTPLRVLRAGRWTEDA
ncbi:amidohydrolase family protein [Cellulomonas sp. APG4]|uniref:N-acetylglucosamine-6-phosphate deacetylase n=1 Tax=Cellulomonas sp. APG4 TaxID=1538656 RepID=UPI00137B7336|nr:amidohydrolase family protein [Cellulomonas sp. APG4]NCT89355.1 amidohydrolase family protein [Cellulomonas sp. APG4]